MSIFPKRYADRVARLRVTFGFILIAAFIWLSHPTTRSLAYGLPISALGLLLRAWATGHLEKNLTLTDSGPYAYVRNPLYMGTSIAAAGLAVAGRSWLLAAIFAAIFILVYLPVIELEEQHLAQIFPDFIAYTKRVPQLLPKYSRPTRSKRFSFELYVRNREYQAALAFAIAIAVLAAKLLYS